MCNNKLRGADQAPTYIPISSSHKSRESYDVEHQGITMCRSAPLFNYSQIDLTQRVLTKFSLFDSTFYVRTCLSKYPQEY